tara:strand:+ start:17081 stop:17326 length:246 start_codon:yes stop_codon:yes gene_type:complete
MAQPSAIIAFGDSNRAFQAGIIYGPVHNEFYLPPGRFVRRTMLNCANGYPLLERPETPPIPSCAIIFYCDRDFVDRGTLLD